MLVFRMITIVCRLAWPYLLCPWRSPLLRWRIETYGIQDDNGRMLHADDVSARRFLGFARHHRIALLRFLRWAALL